jgi:hypothetical protein
MSKKIEAFWGDATADDVARVMAGETVEARFWDDDMQGWTTRTLSGWQTTGVRPLWHSSERFVWTRCQVYREPSWYTERPDPGPGWRLLNKFPDEELKPGDEAWDVWNDKQWRMSDSANGRLPQGRDIWYRRRIEPVEPKFAVGQMVRVVGPKGKPARHWAAAMDEHIGTVCAVRFVPPRDYEGMFYKIGEIAEWAFREDYLEAVEPKHYVLRVGDSVENPNGDRIKVVNPGFEQSHYALKVGDTISTPNGQTITATEKGFEVTQ